MGSKKEFLAFKRQSSKKAEDQFIKVESYLLSKDSNFFAWKDEKNGYWCLIDHKSGLVVKRNLKTLKDASDTIRTILSKEKLSSETNLNVKAMKYYREEYGVKIIDSEINSQYSKYMNNVLNSTNQNQNK